MPHFAGRDSGLTCGGKGVELLLVVGLQGKIFALFGTERLHMTKVVFVHHADGGLAKVPEKLLGIPDTVDDPPGQRGKVGGDIVPGSR